MNQKNHNSDNVPALRFPGFKGEWERKKLGEVTEINPSNKTIPENFIYIDLESVENGELKKETLIKKSDAPSRAQRVLVKDDVLFQMVRPYQMNNLYFDRVGQYVASTGYAQIRTSQKAMFIFQYLHFQKFVDKVIEKCTGTSYPAINSTDLSNIPVSFPTLPEQARIASFFTSIDKKITELKQKKALLEEYKKGVMQRLFLSELGCQGLEDDRINENQKNPSILKSKKSKFRQLRFKNEKGKEFPKWEEKKLGEIAFKNSSNIAANAIEDNFGDYIIYGASGILRGIDFYREEEKYISIVKDGAGVGRVFLCSAKSSVLGTLDIIKPIGGNLYYLFYFLQQTNFLKYVTGSTIPHIYFSDYKTEKILIPSLKEQTLIANFLSSLDEKISQTEIQLKKTQEWKKGLLQKMFC
jgi:type I restriction enzyme, S subunit